MDEAEYIARVSTLAPKEYQNNYSRIREYIEAVYKKERPVYTPKYSDFPGVLRIMQDWVDAYINTEELVHRPKALIIWGPSRCGKTEWARSLGFDKGYKHTYFQGMFNLEVLDDDADYVVFDDVPSKYLISYKQWMGCQRDFNVTDKYKKKKLVSGGWPCVFLMNNDPRSVPEWDTDWVEKNAEIVYVDHPLWEEAPEGVNGERRRPDTSGIVYLADVSPLGY